MGYPVVNSRALGRADLFPTVAAAPAPVRTRMLGVSMSTGSQALALRKAKELFDRVQTAYPRLVASTGEESARTAFDQAKESLDRAQADYDEAVRASGGEA